MTPTTILRRITFMIAVLYLIAMMGYSSVLIGTLAHELLHKESSKDIIALQINYDGTGMTEAKHFEDVSHKWIYFNGFVIEVTLIVIGMASLFIVMIGGEYWNDSAI